MKSAVLYFFYDLQHHDIYSVEDGNKSKEKADEIRNELKKTFAKINSGRVGRYTEKLKDLRSLADTARKELDLTLRKILSKTNLQIVTQCDYLKPGLI
jgi:hypothetical protein